MDHSLEDIVKELVKLVGTRSAITLLQEQISRLQNSLWEGPGDR